MVPISIELFEPKLVVDYTKAKFAMSIAYKARTISNYINVINRGKLSDGSVTLYKWSPNFSIGKVVEGDSVGLFSYIEKHTEPVDDYYGNSDDLPGVENRMISHQFYMQSVVPVEMFEYIIKYINCKRKTSLSIILKSQSDAMKIGFKGHEWNVDCDNPVMQVTEVTLCLDYNAG